MLIFKNKRKKADLLHFAKTIGSNLGINHVGYCLKSGWGDIWEAGRKGQGRDFFFFF